MKRKVVAVHLLNDHSGSPLVLRQSIETLVKNYSLISQKKFSETCKDQKLYCINTVPSFINYNQKYQIPSHFPWNVHLTKNGHEVISGEIKNYICNNFKNDEFLLKNCF